MLWHLTKVGAPVRKVLDQPVNEDSSSIQNLSILVEMGKLRQGEGDRCNEGCFRELWLSKELSQHTVLTRASFLSGGKPYNMELQNGLGGKGL